MILLQIVCILFALLMLYIIRIHRLKQNIPAAEFRMWIIVWVAFIFLTFFPQTTAGLAETLHISRVFDLFVILAFMVLTYITFMNRVHYERLERKLEKIIRKNAMDQKENREK